MVWMKCPSCNQEGWFDKIGNVPPTSYECRRCGNIEQGIECPDCGSRSTVSGWWHFITYCRSCGSTKTPVWSDT